MKRTLAWLAGLVGIAALGRTLARRRQPTESVAEHPPTVATADPAEELRRKLAGQRQPEPEAEAGAGAERVAQTLEERRARVHAKAREAIDAMDDDGPAA